MAGSSLSTAWSATRRLFSAWKNNVRDNFHDIRSKQVREQQSEKDYTWRFESSISVLKRKKEQYAKDFETWTTKIAQQQEAELGSQQPDPNKPVSLPTEKTTSEEK